MIRNNGCTNNNAGIAVGYSINVIDSQHTDPDYSVAYVVLETDSDAALKGYGLTFTVGRGTEIGEIHKSKNSANMSYDNVMQVDPMIPVTIQD